MSIVRGLKKGIGSKSWRLPQDGKKTDISVILARLWVAMTKQDRLHTLQTTVPCFLGFHRLTHNQGASRCGVYWRQTSWFLDDSLWAFAWQKGFRKIPQDLFYEVINPDYEVEVSRSTHFPQWSTPPRTIILHPEICDRWAFRPQQRGLSHLPLITSAWLLCFSTYVFSFLCQPLPWSLNSLSHFLILNKQVNRDGNEQSAGFY